MYQNSVQTLDSTRNDSNPLVSASSLIIPSQLKEINCALRDDKGTDLTFAGNAIFENELMLKIQR
jgi:hypothetical protein